MVNPCLYVHPLQALSALTAFMAAILWLWASMKEVPDEFNQKRMEELNGDIPPVLRRQSKALAIQGRINAWAAFFAGIAALFQIVLAYMPACSWGGW
jgi:hypothetical protein